MHSAPSWDELNKALTEAGDTLGMHEKRELRLLDGNNEPKPFCFFEFPCLALVFKTDKVCRQAMGSSRWSYRGEK